tara:strand:+ start:175 stop:561 length:387 start_codon:yes stop_codon:yes gene_type:complete
MNFQHKDKLKRVKLAKELHSKGYSLKQLAEYFDISEETVDEYLKQEISVDENNEIIERKEKETLTLDAFSDKTTTIDKALPEVEVQGNRCINCKTYHKFEQMIKWKNDKNICKACFSTLDKSKIDELI